MDKNREIQTHLPQKSYSSWRKSRYSLKILNIHIKCMYTYKRIYTVCIQKLLLTQDYQKKENFYMLFNFLYLWYGPYFFSIKLFLVSVLFTVGRFTRTLDNASHPNFCLKISELCLLVMCISLFLEADTLCASILYNEHIQI